MDEENLGGEPLIRGSDTMGLAGTDRDLIRNPSKKAHFSRKNAVEDDSYANMGNNDSAESVHNTDTLKITVVDGGYLYWDEESGEVFDEFDEDGFSKRDRNNYLPFLESDSGELSKDNVVSSKAPVWAFALLVILGIGIFGVSAYAFVTSSFDNVEAQSVPMPEEEELFDHNSNVTYTGPTSYEMDWDSEFSQVDKTADGDSGAVVLPSVDIYSEMIATGEEEGRMVLPHSPLSSWYENSVSVGSEEGNSIIASHVNHIDGQDLAPFSRLNQTERGTLIGVEDDEGNQFVYEVTDMSLYERVAIPDEYFRTDGDHELHLVTCSGDVIEDNEAGDRFFEYNLIVSAELIEEL